MASILDLCLERLCEMGILRREWCPESEDWAYSYRLGEEAKQKLNDLYNVLKDAPQEEANLVALCFLVDNIQTIIELSKTGTFSETVSRFVLLDVVLKETFGLGIRDAPSLVDKLKRRGVHVDEKVERYLAGFARAYESLVSTEVESLEKLDALFARPARRSWYAS